MSDQLDADVKIILTAEDRASEEVKGAVDRINREYKDFNNTQRAVTRGFQLQHRSFNDAVQGLQLAGRVAGTVTHVFNSLNIMELRRLETARDLKKAQEDINNALAEYGPASVEYRKALEAEQEIRQRQRIQQQQDILQYAGLGVQTAGSFAQIGRSKLVQRGLSKLGGLGAVGGLGALGTLGAVGAGVGGGVAQGLGTAFSVSGIADKLAGTDTSGRLADFYKSLDPTGLTHGIVDFFRGGKSNKTIQNQTVNVNTNEIGVTFEDMINGQDVLGSDY